MATAKKLPSGQWRVLAYIGTGSDGKRQYKSFTAGTKKEAEYMAAEYKLTEQRPSSPSKMTVGQIIDQYIESKTNVLSPTTIHAYQIYRSCWMQSIMGIVASKLTQTQLQESINIEAAKHAPKTVQNAYGLFTAAMKASGIRKDFNVSIPKKIKKYRELPSPEQVIAAVHGTDIELPAMIAIWMGLRLSEICGIKRKDIVDGVLTINRVKVTTKGPAIVKESAKTYNSNRQIEVPQAILDLIPDGNPEDYLVKYRGNTVYMKFLKALENADVPKMRFHDLRHLNASVMVALGIPDKYAMERGGWSTNKTLQNVYQHTFSTERKKVDATINAYFESIMQHEMQHEIKKPR